MIERRNLADWLALLGQRHAQTIQLGLERVQAVLARMSRPAGDAVVITVGGTNGKGSVCALLEAMLGAAGYRTGTYTSPHLLRYNERVRIDGREVDDSTLVAALERVERSRGDSALTYFEHGTLAAWEVLAGAGVEVMILEVGLGGRLDAVNAFDADCAILTSIAMDHQEYLGDTREAIGFEKAGIFRPGRPAICADEAAPDSVIDHAARIGASLWLKGRDFGCINQGQQWGFWLQQGSAGMIRRSGLAHPALRGANQLGNASAAMAALEALKHRLPVPMQAVRRGMMEVTLPGRFQVLPGRPAVILDVAHNVQAAHALADNLLQMGFFPETFAVLAMNADKDVEGVVSALERRVEHWLLASLPGPRGLSASRLAERVRACNVDGEIRCFATPRNAFRAARTAAGDSDRIAVFGSFVTVAEAMHEIQVAGAGVSRERS